MKLPTRILLLLLIISLIFSISCNSDNDDSANESDPIEDVPTNALFDTIVFSVIGDVPYNASQRSGLVEMIQAHNTKSNSSFVVHVGDIKPGADPCIETVYQDVNGLLKKFTTPTFMLLGDNEYNDCDDPVSALQLWNRYFLNFHQNWTFNQNITYQESRSENFAWLQDKVMFVGLNLVGSSVHNQEEWDDRLTDNGNFLRTFVTANKIDAEALVIFGHANMFDLGPSKFRTFTDVMRSVAADFEKPILYMQGDGHFWISDKPYTEQQNIHRVQIEGGANAVQVTVNPNLEQPFVFDREFLD